ncbi:hypothetical protein FBULB1_1366 [Fusarium bulbicola]|nr:hypothetical protein FBULB1_1366 [Fusarium bulbicola]
MTTPAAGQEETAPPSPPSSLDEDMKTGYTVADEDALEIEKELVASTHVQLAAGQEDPASSGREPNLTEGTSDRIGDSSQKFHERRECVKPQRRVVSSKIVKLKIRRARFAKNWVDKAETLANETRDDRQDLGAMGPFLHRITASGSDSYKSIAYGDGSTKFQRVQNGTFGAVFPSRLIMAFVLQPHYDHTTRKRLDHLLKGYIRQL